MRNKLAKTGAVIAATVGLAVGGLVAAPAASAAPVGGGLVIVTSAGGAYRCASIDARGKRYGGVYRVSLAIPRKDGRNMIQTVRSNATYSRLQVCFWRTDVKSGWVQAKLYDSSDGKYASRWFWN